VKPFKRRRRGGLVATFEPGEAQVLASLAGQVVELLRDRNGESQSEADPLAGQLGLGGPSLPPEDPVLQRLLPDAYRDDAEDSAEFRRFTERSLTSAKVANAEAILAALVAAGLDDVDEEAEETLEVELDADAAQSWLRALTDIRLSLAVRLGIEDDDDAMLLGRSDDEAVVAMTELYDWLGYVQETLVQALS
jgi:cytochrome P450